MIVSDHIRQIIPYPPGKPLEELEREYGIRNAIKLASNENPLGTSPKAIEAIKRVLGNLHRYPDGGSFYLKQKLSEKFNVPFKGIVLGNGSNEIIEMVSRAFLQRGDEIVVPEPSFLMYRIIAQVVGAKVVSVPLLDYRLDLEGMASSVTDRTRVVIVNNPNNPTGTVVSKDEWEAFLKKLPGDTIVVVDEAYIEFVRDGSSFGAIDYISLKGPYVVALRTFSKAYGLAGLRIGYGFADPEVADYLDRVRQPFNINMLAQVGALAALDDDEFLEKTRQTIWKGLDYLYEKIDEMGLKYVPSQANFFLIELPVSARSVYQALLRRGVIVRAMDSYGLERFIRVTVGLPEENERFISALREVLQEV
ncbi:MAG: histidinol-phosphate transaminase [Syntrophobacterales bacterium]|nr:histidinol-phosphate transaminase [Syntrophobacterales bacterium]